MISRRLVLGATLVAPAVRSARAHPMFPERTIRYVCPFPPGATNDNVSRVMARALSARLGVTVVVENRAGAGGLGAAPGGAKAAPDGDTILAAQTPEVATSPHRLVRIDRMRFFT